MGITPTLISEESGLADPGENAERPPLPPRHPESPLGSTHELEQLFLNQFEVDPGEMEKAHLFQSRYGGRLESILVHMGILSEENALQAVARWLRLPVLETLADARDYLETDASPPSFPLNDYFLLERKWLPLRPEGDGFLFLTSDPLNNDVNQYLALESMPFEVMLGSETLFREMADLKRFQEEGELTGPTDLSSSEVERLREMATEAPTVNLVNSLLTRSLKLGASDLHLEPFKGSSRGRIRVDGVLRDLETIPPAMQLPVISRLKIMAGMDIAEKRRPQDGKIAMRIAAMELDIRVSSIPLAQGESMVLRFLVRDNIQFDLDILGVSPDLLARLEKDLTVTSGVILMTGPTGSGKTTTLYSLLNRLNNGQRKIITLEDPVEYQLPGLNQTQVQPAIGFDFASGLRSIVRQDPDVIMVGEIRDGETARIALQSALTGHLVFSTVHTNDTPTAFVRLLDLGVEEYLLNAAIHAILAQRLVRRICPECSAPDPKADELIKRHHLQALAAKWQVDKIQLHRGVGCDHCAGSGYRGRIAVIEYLPCDETLRAIPYDGEFLAKAHAHMQAQGFRNLMEDGLYKVLLGVTTVDEVLRVAG
ncbi:MAG: Flp pilus assembly complex ATPase component TadA [Magnetococcales bacterium]|nr:Flp pilus assembly complex ATPase component TadA [Magnetococcales bacterium]